MSLRFWLDGIRLSMIQVLSMLAAFLAIFVVLAFLALTLIPLRSLGLEGIDFGSLPLAYIIPLAAILLVYSLIWFAALRAEYAREDFNLPRTIIFSLLPNLLLIPWFFYLGFFTPVDRSGCGFIYPRDVFYCLAYSLVLFPVFVTGLSKWVFPPAMEPVRTKNTLLLAAALLLILLALILISVYVIEPTFPLWEVIR